MLIHFFLWHLLLCSHSKCSKSPSKLTHTTSWTWKNLSITILRSFSATPALMRVNSGLVLFTRKQPNKQFSHGKHWNISKNYHYFNYIMLHKPGATSVWLSVFCRCRIIWHKNTLIYSKAPFQFTGLDLGAYLDPKCLVNYYQRNISCDEPPIIPWLYF